MRSGDEVRQRSVEKRRVAAHAELEPAQPHPAGLEPPVEEQGERDGERAAGGHRWTSLAGAFGGFS